MDSMDEIKIRMQKLEDENKYLKSLLDDAGIIYDTDAHENLSYGNTGNTYDSDQGARIKRKDEITDEDARNFFYMFCGRVDVFAKRNVARSTGKIGYYTQCDNLWEVGCHKRKKDGVKCKHCKLRAYSKLRIRDIISHLKGETENATDVIGIYPLFPNGGCRFLVFDFDNHDKGAEALDFANADDEWKDEVDAVRRICRINGIDALVERSRSGRGAHIWIFFQGEIEASLARRFGYALLRVGAESVNLKSFRYYDRMIPAQDVLPEGGLGTLIALPLQGMALKDGNSAFIDEDWNAYPDQWKVLFSKERLSRAFIEEKMAEWESTNIKERDKNSILAKDGEKPWEKTKGFCSDDVDGKMEITMADGIYVKSTNLKVRLQNRVRELAAFPNPVFHKNRSMGLSNFQNSSFVYLGSDEGEYIKIPRGLSENLISKCDEAGIKYNMNDETCKGKAINVSFNGELKESQMPAFQKMISHDMGILHAATAFGKTVVCCDIIAERKVSTLILLPLSSLIGQWEEALNNFLTIDEKPPEYTTPKGRKKVRKSVIGKLQGAHDSTTGIIDIAMVGSVIKKGECHKRLKEYGMVILDECHHAAADTIVEVMKNVKAKYIYGVTATPVRGDSLERINYMLLGQIRHRYTAKERAAEQGIDHLVYPRFTRTVIPRFQARKPDADSVLFDESSAVSKNGAARNNKKRPSGSKLNANENYELLRYNDDRDGMIVGDVEECIKKNRTPVILSKYVDHSEKLYERLKGYADHIFLLTGKNKKEHSRVLEQMKGVPMDESLILIGTGGLIGEGFDFPRLDTLIMATPVSGRQVVEQFAGRLNRDYDGKENVIIYDYIDINIQMFKNMYNKRLKAYKQIGYDVYSGEAATKQEAGHFFGFDNYKEVYERDLVEAEKEIIISSPTISGAKVNEILMLLKPRLETGVRVSIVTYKPDCYGFGDSSVWMEMQERMRVGGFEVNLVEETCECFAILDREIVWYGGVKFLGKEDVEDTLMRVCNKSIAAELLDLTFGAGKKHGEKL